MQVPTLEVKFKQKVINFPSRQVLLRNVQNVCVCVGVGVFFPYLLNKNMHE